MADEIAEVNQLSTLAALFEMAEREGKRTLTFAPTTLVDYAAAIRFVLAERSGEKE